MQVLLGAKLHLAAAAEPRELAALVRVQPLLLVALGLLVAAELCLLLAPAVPA
tara:strand:+ start:640 stop:798 length:159 start_codon:yes stop_codon:yes gene_type:complete